MNSAIENLLEFVASPNPRFVCRGVGPGAQEAEGWIALLEHRVAAPASEQELAQIVDCFAGDPPQALLDFYRTTNGVTLYIDTVQSPTGFTARGIHVAPVSEWPSLGSDASGWIESLSQGDREALVPAWTDNAIVFAQVPDSGNYFILGVDGEYRGAVYYFDHDGFEFELFAESFSIFLAKIATEPAALLYRLGCCTRYSDGKTDIQWIPETYGTAGGP